MSDEIGSEPFIEIDEEELREFEDIERQMDAADIDPEEIVAALEDSEDR